MTELLIIVLDELKPAFVLSPDETDIFYLGGREFKDTGIRTIVGFYDWLRTDEKEVIGVRLTIFDEELDYLVPELARPNYVQEIIDSVGVEIFFTDERQYNPDYSDDQDFMDNRIYQSADGGLAISFDAEYAIESLKANQALTLANYDEKAMEKPL